MQLNEEKDKKLKEKKYIQKRVTICLILTLVILCGFIAKLFMWQIVEGEEYKDIARRSTAYTVKADATRGEILDCNGEGLAVNKTGYEIVIDKLYVDGERLDKTILKLVSLMNKGQEVWIDNLPIKLVDGKFEFINSNKSEIKTLKSQDFLNLTNKATAEECVDLLAERYAIKDAKSKNQLRSLVSVHYNMEKNYFSNSTPYIFAKDISDNMVAIISENMQGVRGVEVQTYLTRYNPEGNTAPHILGALGMINQEEYEQKAKENKEYRYNDSIGKFGLELAYEDMLKGVGGEKIVQKDSEGNVTNEVQTVNAKPGKTLYLTIDKNLQKVANKALETQVKAAKANGEREALYKGKNQGEDCETGAVVMLNVKDFSVLAAASYPTYDLNKYSKYGQYYVSLAKDENAPMYNRAFIGSFAPGSVFKPCVACGALQEGIISPSTYISCTKYYNYYPTNPVACMGTHGSINLNTAITKSCNYYFAETGRLLGINTMYLYAEHFGLGEKTGLEVAESKGFLAGRDSTSWMDGNTVQAAIGQSDNAFTPVQLATYVATIANNGTRYKTHLIKEIRNYERTKVIEKNSVKKPEVVDSVGVSGENLKIVQNAMRSVVSDPGGTAYSVFGNYKVDIAAKTGTAENAGSDHTVFICYAPFDKPEVAVAVVLEHGAYGRYSMGVAKSLLDEYFK